MLGIPSRNKVEGNQFWDGVWASEKGEAVHRQAWEEGAGTDVKAFLDRIGQVRGRRVLELGCGQGDLTAYLAHHGGIVTAVDTSAEAIERTKKRLERFGLARNASVIHGDIFDNRLSLASFDIITGIFILHHLDPFPGVPDRMKQLLKPEGRGIFLENNGRNKLLMFARSGLVGRFGVPKYGDPHESPLPYENILELRKTFAEVSVEVTELWMFRLIDSYLLKGKKEIRWALDAFDDFLYKILPPLRKYSYRQIVSFSMKANSS